MMARQARPCAKIMGSDTHMILEAVPAPRSRCAPSPATTTKPGVTTIPVRDLPPSETALVWLATSDSREIQALARAAADVLAAQQDHDGPAWSRAGKQMRP